MGTPLLRAAAERLRTLVRDRILIARTGGDRSFPRANQYTRHLAAAASLARRDLSRRRTPFDLGDIKSWVGGECRHPQLLRVDGTKLDQIHEECRHGVVTAKSNGRWNITVFRSRDGYQRHRNDALLNWRCARPCGRRSSRLELQAFGHSGAERTAASTLAGGGTIRRVAGYRQTNSFPLARRYGLISAWRWVLRTM